MDSDQVSLAHFLQALGDDDLFFAEGFGYGRNGRTAVDVEVFQNAQAQRVGNVRNAFDGFAHDVFGQLLFHLNLFLISFAFYI